VVGGYAIEIHEAFAVRQYVADSHRKQNGARLKAFLRANLIHVITHPRDLFDSLLKNDSAIALYFGSSSFQQLAGRNSIVPEESVDASR
jgi:hypothetical protein